MNQKLPFEPSPTRISSRDLGVMALLAVVACLFVALHVSFYTKVGPIDELQHIDYLYKAPEIVRSGDRVGHEAMNEEACRGIDANFLPPPCEPTGAYDPSDFQENGFNTAAGNTPIYYTMTRAIAWPITTVFDLDSPVTAARLVGGLWLAVGLILTYAVGRRLKADRGPLFAALVVLAATPSVLYPAATVSPDAMIVPVGAAAVWSVLWWQEKPGSRWWALVLMSILAVLIKMTNLMVIGGLGIYLLINALPAVRARAVSVGHTRVSARNYLAAAILVGVSTVVALGGWLSIQSNLAYGNPADVPMNAQFAVDSFPVAGLIDSLGRFLNPLDSPNVWVGEVEIVNAMQRASGLLFVGGLVAGALFMFDEDSRTSLARAWVLAAVAGGIGFVVLGYVSQGSYFLPPSRYAATLLPFTVALTASYLNSRFSRGVVWFLAGAAVVGTVLRLTEIWV